MDTTEKAADDVFRDLVSSWQPDSAWVHQSLERR